MCLSLQIPNSCCGKLLIAAFAMDISLLAWQRRCFWAVLVVQISFCKQSGRELGSISTTLRTEVAEQVAFGGKCRGSLLLRISRTLTAVFVLAWNIKLWVVHLFQMFVDKTLTIDMYLLYLMNPVIFIFKKQGCSSNRLPTYPCGATTRLWDMPEYKLVQILLQESKCLFLSEHLKGALAKASKRLVGFPGQNYDLLIQLSEKLFRWDVYIVGGTHTPQELAPSENWLIAT